MRQSKSILGIEDMEGEREKGREGEREGGRGEGERERRKID